MDNFQTINLCIPALFDLESNKDLTLYQIIDYLKNAFTNFEINNVDVSKKNLERDFQEIKKELLEIKDGNEYKPKEERILLNELIEKCDLSSYLNKLLILNSNNEFDEDFDLRDIKLEHEIKNLITFYSVLISNSSLESELLSKYSNIRRQILDVIDRCAYSFLNSFQLSGNVGEIFDAFRNIFTGRKKLKFPEGIDTNSKDVFSYKFTSEDVDICSNYFYENDIYSDNFDDLNEQIDLGEEELIGTRYFSFEKSSQGETFMRTQLDFTSAFIQWYEKELMKYSIPIPPPKDQYPQLNRAWVEKSPNNLPISWKGFDYQNYGGKVLNPQDYFNLPSSQEIWENSQKEFFNSFRLRESFVKKNLNNQSLEYISDEIEFDLNNDSGFVYLIRNQDIYKIGITENLLNRMSQLNPDEIIDVIKCRNFRDLERNLHREFKEFRIPQTEYFRLSNKQLRSVSEKFKKWAK
tara:strand:- start:128 stop:1522 length:1395 start_codon:yes stop_codon:yes gene_type:complete